MTPKLGTQLNLRSEISDISLLTKCWKQIYQGKSEDKRSFSRGFDDVSLNEFKKEAKKNLQGISERLFHNQYKFSPLKGTPIKKSNGNYRLVTVPIVADRIVHRAILSKLAGIFYPLINTRVSYCGVKKSFFSKKSDVNHIKAIRKLVFHVEKKNFWVYESDLEGFFDNLSKERLLESIYQQLLPDTSINTLIKEIIYFEIGNSEIFSKIQYIGKLKRPESDRGVPQGSSLSPLFSNIYLYDFDNKMKALCGDAFIRYVDDFIIMAPEKKIAESYGASAKQYLEDIGLQLSPNKTHLTNLNGGGNSIDFLGLKINQNHISAKDPGKIKSRITAEITFKSKKVEAAKTKGRSAQMLLMNSIIRGVTNFVTI